MVDILPHLMVHVRGHSFVKIMPGEREHHLPHLRFRQTQGKPPAQRRYSERSGCGVCDHVPDLGQFVMWRAFLHALK